MRTGGRCVHWGSLGSNGIVGLIRVLHDLVVVGLIRGRWIH